MLLLNNPATIRHPLNFAVSKPAKWGDIDVSIYDDLLSDRVLPGMAAYYGTSDWQTGTTDDVVWLLCHWLHSYMDKGAYYEPGPYNDGTWYQGDPYTEDWQTLEGNLAWIDAGNEGVCSHFANTFQHVLSACGIPARQIEWYSTVHQGDRQLEYYSPELAKWVLIAPICNMRFRDGGPLGELMSMLEIHESYNAGTGDTIYQETGQALNHADPAKVWQVEGAEVPMVYDGFYLYSENIAWLVKYGMGEAWEDATSEGPIQWYDNPVPFAFEGVDFPDTDNRAMVDFDAFAIQLGTPTLSGVTLTIPIDDEYLAWPATYTAKSYDAAGTLLNTSTWVRTYLGATGTIDATGAATVEVYAVNSRGGWSNYVTVDLTTSMLATVDEYRSFDKAQLASATTYPDAAIIAKDATIRERLARICGVDFCPTTHTSETFDGDGSSSVVCKWPRVIEVTAAAIRDAGTATWTALTAPELAQLQTYDDGEVYWDYGYFTAGHNNVQLTYTAGFATVPAAIKDAALTIAVNELVTSNVSDRITSMSDGENTYSCAQPGANWGWWTSIPSVNATIADFMHRAPGIA